MIEVIYKEENPDIQEGEEGFCLPRNIRQIGVAGEKYKIYMEDYVYTFLIRLARTEENQEVQKGRVAVLTGEIKWKTGTAYLFIRGAVMAEDMEAAVDHVDFSVQVWKQIHEDQKKYFEDQEIVGWFFSQPRIFMGATEPLDQSKTASSVIIEEITPSPTPKIEKKSADNERIKKKTIKSKENEKKKVSVQQTPKPANQTGEIDQSDKTEQIYKEEADTRKAQKRMREELQKENETAASESVHESYVIQPGDTLFQISLERYGDAKEISRICALNGIKEDEIIYPGQVIVLP